MGEEEEKSGGGRGVERAQSRYERIGEERGGQEMMFGAG